MLTFHILMAHIIFLIVSCKSKIVASSNLSIVSSMGIEVYSSPLKFQKGFHIHIMRYDILKSWFTHTFCVVEDNLALHNTKGMGKP